MQAPRQRHGFADHLFLMFLVLENQSWLPITLFNAPVSLGMVYVLSETFPCGLECARKEICVAVSIQSQ